MENFQPLSFPFRLTVLVIMLLVFLWVEYMFPLRKITQPKAHRVGVNIGIAVMSALTIRLCFYPIVFLISEWTIKENIGILNYLKLPLIVHLFASVLLLDYTLYIWHWPNHKIPFLWRFHNAHCIDLGLDVSTGHRSAQIILFGINPFTLVLFEKLVTTAAQFHHSNIKIPHEFERILNYLFVTPRMHGIHHSIVKEETDSNFSTIFSIWDRFHKYLQLSIPQDKIIIGVAAYRSLCETTFINNHILPFTKQSTWKLPDGSIPIRRGE